MNRFRWIVAGVAIACLFGITGCSLAEMQETREISDYLESRYGSRDFEIQREETDGTLTYRVAPAGYPEIENMSAVELADAIPKFHLW